MCASVSSTGLGRSPTVISFARRQCVCSCLLVMKSKTKQANDIAVNTRVSEDTRAMVDRVCRAEGIGMSDVVREALQLFLAIYGAAGNRFLSSIERDAILSQIGAMAGRVREAIEVPGNPDLSGRRRAAVYRKSA